MTSKPYCSVGNDICQKGYFCPAEGVMHEQCQRCSSDIKVGQGCNCTALTSIRNCMKCRGKHCSECIPGFFTQLNKCTRCKEGCKTCTSLRNCTMCEDNYIFNTSSKICTPRCITNDDCRNIQGQYCDQQTHMCTPCGSFCSACVSSDFCYTCTSTYHTLTTAGLCTAGCTYLQDGQYCKDGKAEPCAGGIESACKCGQYQNCATCSQDGYCTSCLTNYMQDMFGACSQCAYGYEMNESICIPIQFTHQASGVCSLTSLTCRAGYFCPAKDYNLVQCLPCNNNMAYGESCYCQDSIPTNNCIECAGGQCTGLLYVHNDHTMAENNCRPGCQICDYYQNCIQCDETHYIDYSTLICYEKCNTNQECAGPEPRYCDPDSMTCSNVCLVAWHVVTNMNATNATHFIMSPLQQDFVPPNVIIFQQDITAIMVNLSHVLREQHLCVTVEHHKIVPLAILNAIHAIYV
ncbi:Cysteine-rich protein [Spironucleus salmonicida]|uniref:Cysteine-rich protein n=1 Tax=Spironucleus salmonicida TaxID=348837 RepID=A0A9P8S079_9EUKA|nr:Cysteine-rich protein [Spironucleus salmonicida]